MNPEKNSPDLDQLKQLLAKSYDGAEGQDVPPLPDGLRDRIAEQYGRSAASPTPQVESGKVGFFSALTQLFATPVMRAVAAVVLLLLVATVVIINNPPSPNGTIRGGGGTPSSITCVVYGLDRTEQAAVAQSGLAAEAMTTAATSTELAEALQGEGARLVINGETDQILGYLPGETTPTLEKPLPSDPTALTATIARMIAELTK